MGKRLSIPLHPALVWLFLIVWVVAWVFKCCKYVQNQREQQGEFLTERESAIRAARMAAPTSARASISQGNDGPPYPLLPLHPLPNTSAFGANNASIRIVIPKHSATPTVEAPLETPPPSYEVATAQMFRD